LRRGLRLFLLLAAELGLEAAPHGQHGASCARAVLRRAGSARAFCGVDRGGPSRGPPRLSSGYPAGAAPRWSGSRWMVIRAFVLM